MGSIVATAVSPCAGAPADVIPTPVQLGAPEYWETESAADVTLSGSDVTGWIGRVLGTVIAPDEVTRRPDWSADFGDGAPGMTFVGANIDRLGGTLALDAGADHTIMMLVRQTSADSILLSWVGAGTRRAYVRNIAATAVIYGLDDAVGGSAAPSRAAVTLNTWSIIGARVAAGASQLIPRVNGSDAASPGTQPSGDIAISTLFVGYGLSAFSGQIAGIWPFPSLLSTAQWDAMRDYARAKWPSRVP